MRTIFIYSGFIVAFLMIVMGGVLIFSEPQDSKIKNIPWEVIGGLMIAWGIFRGYRSYVAYKNAKWEHKDE